MQHPRRHMKKLTTAFGAPVDDNQNIATAGERGPVLLQNIWFLEKLAHFDREVIPERRMHAKGSGAFGTFTVTHDITKYTKARIFSGIGKKTEMFARFSTVAGERGAADAERDIRGFALKFYTDEGNWDLVGNNTPVFFFRDPLKFPDLNHAIKRDPRTGMRSADNNWDFWSSLPEALHQVTVVMTDRGIPRSFRHMHGFGSHTYSFINEQNKRFWVKFTFAPATIVTCISFFTDKMLQGRLFSYGDTQRYRFGVNHSLIPINAPKCPFHSYHRDGAMRVDGNSGAALSYEPNRHGEWQEQPDFAEPPLAIDGDAARFNYREDDADYYSQPGNLFRMLKPDEQQRLFENTARAIGAASKEVQDRHVGNCSKADPAYGKGVAKAIAALQQQQESKEVVYAEVRG